MVEEEEAARFGEIPAHRVTVMRSHEETPLPPPTPPDPA